MVSEKEGRTIHPSHGRLAWDFSYMDLFPSTWNLLRHLVAPIHERMGCICVTSVSFMIDAVRLGILSTGEVDGRGRGRGRGWLRPALERIPTRRQRLDKGRWGRVYVVSRGGRPNRDGVWN